MLDFSSCMSKEGKRVGLNGVLALVLTLLILVLSMPTLVLMVLALLLMIHTFTVTGDTVRGHSHITYSVIGGKGSGGYPNLT